jgi:REP element-mobilizing transposase RayT
METTSTSFFKHLLMIQSHELYKPSRVLLREMFKTFSELKRLMWGAKLWEQGFFARTVGDETTSEMIKRYIEKQGQQREVKKSNQLTFF